MAKFLLLAHYEPGTGEWTDGGTPADIRAHLDHDRALHDALAASGELLEAAHVTGPSHARVVAGATVRAVSPGRPLLIRYWIVDVSGLDRAVEIAGLVSSAPGWGGRPIEVRPLMVPEPLRES